MAQQRLVQGVDVTLRGFRPEAEPQHPGGGPFIQPQSGIATAGLAPVTGRPGGEAEALVAEIPHHHLAGVPRQGDGADVGGIPGALITVVGAALPPLIIISVISVLYQAFRSNRYVSMAMAGMLAGVAAVIFDVVINMAWSILKNKRLLPIAVMLAAFVSTRFFAVNIILIILVCGVIGALDMLYLQKKEVEE